MNRATLLLQAALGRHHRREQSLAALAVVLVDLGGIATAREGDVLLIGTTGAYGRSMASSYNLRESAVEKYLPARR